MLRFHYLNAKKLNVEGKDKNTGNDECTRCTRMHLVANKHFSGIPVNTTLSSVHVPTNVLDTGTFIITMSKLDIKINSSLPNSEPKVVNAIAWSKKLDGTFEDNYERDPSLSWQYFGSNTGFMRQYPAMKWLLDEKDPDLYDCRMRDWYIKSAASPKVGFADFYFGSRFIFVADFFNSVRCFRTSSF